MINALTNFFNKPDFGHLVIRLGIGVSFAIMGVLKLLGGVDRWTQLGKATEALGLKLSVFHTTLGLAATLAELIGGIAIAFGFAYRTAAFFLFITMFVASVSVIQGDPSPWTRSLWPISMAFFFFGAMFTGPGKIAVQKS